jgi:hypothetical protein
VVVVVAAVLVVVVFVVLLSPVRSCRFAFVVRSEEGFNTRCACFTQASKTVLRRVSFEYRDCARNNCIRTTTPYSHSQIFAGSANSTDPGLTSELALFSAATDEGGMMPVFGINARELGVLMMKKLMPNWGWRQFCTGGVVCCVVVAREWQ